MATRTRFIVNADDFGYSRAVTDGIVECHTRGVLTSATLMTTMPDRDRAIDIAKATPTLGVGIHLCLTQGAPLTKCTKLLGADGRFRRAVPKLARRLLSRAARQEAYDEWLAQVEYARGRGLRVTHLDSHKHVHHLPMLQEAAMRVAEEHGIKYIRRACETRVAGMPSGGVGYRVLGLLARRLGVKMAGRGLLHTDWFFGLAATGRTTAEVWQKIIAACPPGTGEIMVHPGYISDISASDTRLLQGRLDELGALQDPAVRAGIAKAGIELVHYGAL